MKYCIFVLMVAIGLRDATFGSQSDLKGRVAQQVDRIRMISGYSDEGFFGLPGVSSGDDGSPIAELTSYGMDAIPSLVPYLSDTSPTQAYRTHGNGMKRRAVVNEYVIFVINRIADHHFYLPPESDGSQRYVIPNPALPTNISELELQILSWWQENRTKSLVERKIEDLNDPIHDNRFAAYEWFARTRATEGREPIEQRIDALLIGEVDTLKQSEMAACAEGLSQIGDRDSESQVRKVCDHLSYWLCEWHAAAGSNQIAALFKAYKALSNLGFRDEALSRLEVLKAKCLAEMDKSVQEEFLREFGTMAHDQSGIQIKIKKRDQSTSDGFSLTAQTEKDVIGVGNPLNLSLTIKNVSKKTGFIREPWLQSSID